MINIIKTMFEWPQGIVVGNLIASFICWVPMTIHHHYRFRRIEKKIDNSSNGK